MKTIQPFDTIKFHSKVGDLLVCFEQCYKINEELATICPIHYKNIC